MILILTLLWTPIGIRRIVPVVDLVLILIMGPVIMIVVPIIVVIPIIAIVTTIGSLILRIESIVACQSYVIVLETNLTLDWAPTTATTSMVETTPASAIMATRTLWIWRILIRIHSISVGVQIRVVNLSGVQQTHFGEIYSWCEEITQSFEFGLFVKP